MTAIVLIAIKLGTDIYVPLRVNSNCFCDPTTFSVVKFFFYICDPVPSTLTYNAVLVSIYSHADTPDKNAVKSSTASESSPTELFDMAVDA